MPSIVLNNARIVSLIGELKAHRMPANSQTMMRPWYRRCGAIGKLFDDTGFHACSALTHGRGRGTCIQPSGWIHSREVSYTAPRVVIAPHWRQTWPRQTLLVNSRRPKIHAPGAGFIHGICRTLASFDCRLQDQILKRFGINQQSHSSLYLQ